MIFSLEVLKARKRSWNYLRFIISVENYGWAIFLRDFPTCYSCSYYSSLIYLLNINNRNTRTRFERRHWRRSGVFIVNFEHMSHLVLEFLTFEHVIAAKVMIREWCPFFFAGEGERNMLKRIKEVGKGSNFCNFLLISYILTTYNW